MMQFWEKTTHRSGACPRVFSLIAFYAGVVRHVSGSVLFAVALRSNAKRMQEHSRATNARTYARTLLIGIQPIA